MLKKAFWAVLAVVVVAIALSFPGSGLAGWFDDGLTLKYSAALKGKVVAFVPVSMGFDLTQGWLAGMERQAKELGYKIIVRDPNWNIDAGSQMINQLISEKPDILIFHNHDRYAYNKLVQKALDAGINVSQLNLKTPNNGDAFVGGDWYAVGYQQLETMGKLCGEGSGKSGEIAIIGGPPTTPSTEIGMFGVKDALAARKDLKVVSTQSGDYDANKEHAIASAILKQHPNLCGIIGMWDNSNVGIGAAVHEAGLTGKVAVVTSGGGNKASTCDNIAKGAYTACVTWDVRGQTRDLNDVIKILLQTKPKPGSKPFALYTPLEVLTKDNLGPGSCWTLDELRGTGK
jgi:ABC-type sugar transport system substrate-binding protein